MLYILLPTLEMTTDLQKYFFFSFTKTKYDCKDFKKYIKVIRDY